MRDDLVEMIPAHEDPDHISCYSCRHCNAIFTLRGYADHPYCPDCYYSTTDQISKARYNLIKYFRVKVKRKIIPKKDEEVKSE